MLTTGSELNRSERLAATKLSLPSALFRLVRPRQWIKNGFVLGPVIFSRSFESPQLAEHAMLAVMTFCLASSAGYVVNDICDREADKLHPEKRLKRPIAAGDVSVFQAWVLFTFLVTAVALLLAMIPATIPIMAAYLGLTISYSLWLKKMPVVDLFAIAAGFVLRVYAGALAIHVGVTFWMSVTTLCVALYLAAIKRKQELLRNGARSRGVLLVYTPELLTGYAQTSAVATIIFYASYVATSANSLAPSVPLVLFGLFRYQFLADVKGVGESPGDVLFTDPLMLGTIASWGLLCILLLLR